MKKLIFGSYEIFGRDEEICHFGSYEMFGWD
jgi:hypothetical protein